MPAALFHSSSVVQFLAGDEGILQQAGPGHGADATGDRGDPCGPFRRAFEVHVALQASVFHAVDAHVDNDGSGLDPLALDQAGLTHGDHHQIRAAYVLFQITGEAVCDCGGAAGQQQLEGHGAADDVGGADHGGVQSVGADAGALEQTDDAQGSAGAQQGHPLGQASDVIGMKALHVLVRTNALEQLGGVQVGSQRQLYQDAVDGRVIVEPIDQRQQLFLSGVGGQIMGEGDETDLFTVLALVGYVDFGSGIVADQNDGQTRDAQPLLLALVYLVGDFSPEIGGNLLAIDQLGFHDVPGKCVEFADCRMRRGLGKRPWGAGCLSYSNI